MSILLLDDMANWYASTYRHGLHGGYVCRRDIQSKKRRESNLAPSCKIYRRKETFERDWEYAAGKKKIRIVCHQARGGKIVKGGCDQEYQTLKKIQAGETA